MSDTSDPAKFSNVPSFSGEHEPKERSAALTRAEILAVADARFPRWREDIQERFVLELAEGWSAALSHRSTEELDAEYERGRRAGITQIYDSMRDQGIESPPPEGEPK